MPTHPAPTSIPTAPRRSAARRVHACTPYPTHRATRPVIAAEDRTAFTTDPHSSTPDAPTPDRPRLRDAVTALTQQVSALHATIDDVDDHAGSTQALVELLGAIDRAQAAAMRVASGIDASRSLRDNGLPLADVLAMSTRFTTHDRRTFNRVARRLHALPHLQAAFHAGRVGPSEVRAITAELHGLDEKHRDRIDATFADPAAVDGLTADRVIERIRDQADTIRAARLAEDRDVRSIERRFLSVRPQMDGALTLYAELDAEAGATLLEALEAASPSVSSGSRDHTRDAIDDPHAYDHRTRDHYERARIHRSRARQRADGLVRLAESFLGGGPNGRRPRPRVNVVTDISTLTGDTPQARAARLLWQTHAPSVSLTPTAARRLASDADLQFLLTDGTRILGVTRPTTVIPSRVRVAVTTRDQGCRFPGCTAPIAWCDLHHVIPREQGGHTTVDNLVAVCRRHHTAVTLGRWRLTMDEHATVTVRRGRRRATSLPGLSPPPPRANAP